MHKIQGLGFRAGFQDHKQTLTPTLTTPTQKYSLTLSEKALQVIPATRQCLSDPKRTGGCVCCTPLSRWHEQVITTRAHVSSEIFLLCGENNQQLLRLNHSNYSSGRGLLFWAGPIMRLVGESLRSVYCLIVPCTLQLTGINRTCQCIALLVTVLHCIMFLMP